MKMKNRRVVITGGTSGIGFELVKQLCPNNEVIVISRSKQWEGALPDEASVDLIQADLGVSVQLESAVDQLVRRYSSIDLLINNAAIQNTPEFYSEEFDYDGIQKEVDVNFTSVCRLCYLLLPLLNQTTPSAIVNINSGLALSPKRSSAVYCATKGALDVFSQSLGYQLKETQVSVLQAFLPLVATKMTHGRGASKLLPDVVAGKIILGIERGQRVNDIGRAKTLRLLVRIAPGVARRVMSRS